MAAVHEIVPVTQDSSKITYQFLYDEKYIWTAIDRQYRQGPTLLQLPAQFGLLGLCFAVIYLATQSGPAVDAALPATLIVIGILVVGVGGTKAGLFLRFKNNPSYGSLIVITLEDAGLRAQGPHAQAFIEWPMYRRAVRFNDGVLLKMSRAIRWLPDSAIQKGTPELATELVASKVALSMHQ